MHACYALADAGYETIMINCNPETVSTDYDTSDRLYFEPLTDEDVIEVIRREKQNGELRGVIVQLGGQTPLKIAASLEAAGIPILGTSPDAIDLAEDRERFQQLLQKLDLLQPENGIAYSAYEAREIVERVGLPVVIRPSYVLGGRAMEVVHHLADLERYMRDAVVVSGDNPVLIDRFLNNAIEVDVDALCDGTDVYIGGIMEHIEEAEIHSGDPPARCRRRTCRQRCSELRRQTEALARALNVVGLMNVQFAIKDEDIYLLEVNPRGSRTVPFVAKTTGVPLAKLAARVMAGKAGRFQPGRGDAGACGGQGSGFPVRPLPWGRCVSRAGDEINRRGDGNRQRFRSRLCQKSAGIRDKAANRGNRLHLGQG